MSPTGSRELDIVLLGATGFVGRLVAQYLAQHAPSQVRIGLGGRSADRLAEVRGALGPAAQGWPLILTEVTDDAAVAALASRTRVVVSTVGPYLHLGLPLVRACAEAGTDYADLTGETIFIRRSIDACEATARASGARIVHSCGFDSVPSDLGVGLTAARAAADGEGTLAETVLYVRSTRGGLSGGTVDSLRQQILAIQLDPALRAQITSPMALVNEASPHPALPTAHRKRTPGGVGRNARTGDWQTRFFMGGFNRQVVLRSNSIFGWTYGPQFRYREVVDTGSGASGAAKAAIISVGSSCLLVGMWLRPTRHLLNRLLPEPGEGPSERSRRRGCFSFEVEAETTTGARYRTRVGAGMDPGYDGTAVMLGESALCLALDRDVPDRAGVLTPMIAMGDALAARLRGSRFTVTTERLDR